MQTDNKSEIDQHITALLDNILAPTNDAELRGVLKTIEVLTDYVELENVRDTLESDVMFRENREIALIAFDIVRKMHSQMQSGGGADMSAIAVRVDDVPVQTPTESAEVVATDIAISVGAMEEPAAEPEPVEVAVVDAPATTDVTDETPMQAPTESVGLVAADIAIDIGAMEEPAAEPEPIEAATMDEPAIAVEMDGIMESPDGELPPDFKLGAPEISTVIEIPPAESESELELGPEFGCEDPESESAFPTLDVVDFSDSPEVMGAADADGMGDMAGMTEMTGMEGMDVMEDATDMSSIGDMGGMTDIGGMGDPDDMTGNPFEQSDGFEPEFSGLDEVGEFPDSPDQSDPADDRSQKAQEWKSTVEKIKELKKKYVSK